MNKAFYPVLLGFLLLITGCASPELAQSPYTPVEQEWESYIKKSYPAWRPPRTYPPASAAEDPEPGSSVPVSGDFTVVEEDVDIQMPVESLQIEPIAPLPPLPPESAGPIDVEPAALDDDGRFHTVEKGETLWKIASKYYGNGAKWKKIYEANKDILPSPSKIKVGMELVIPPQ